jgi:hypothetical protein
MYIKITLFVLSLFFIMACGEGIVTIDESNYEPKIVVEGYLYPDKPVSGIRITRNLPVNTNVFRNDLILWDAKVSLTDLTNDPDIRYELTFLAESLYYKYTGNDLYIKHGSSYRLDVAAKIDGTELYTSSTTTVPLKGFRILDSLSTDSIYFYQKDKMGNVLKPTLVFQRSEANDFYAFSIVALDATPTTFIYDHPWVRDINEEDVIENLDDLKFSRETIFNTPEAIGNSTLYIEYFHTLFYGRYRITGYAGDKNFKDYFFTHANVMEIDGNLHEPKFHFQGDGIGVCGSAITDTLYFKILP